MIEGLRELDAEVRTGYLRPQQVKEALHVSTRASVFLLESATRFGHFRPRYDVRCPSCSRVVESYDYKYQIPKHLTCVATDECADLTSESVPVFEKVYVFVA